MGFSERFRGDPDESRISDLSDEVARAESVGRTTIDVPVSAIRSLLVKLSCLRGAVDLDHVTHAGIVRHLAAERWHYEQVRRAAEEFMAATTVANQSALTDAIDKARKASVAIHRGMPAETVLEYLMRWAEADSPDLHAGNHGFVSGHHEARRRVRSLVSQLTQKHAREIALEQDAIRGNAFGGGA